MNRLFRNLCFLVMGGALVCLAGCKDGDDGDEQDGDTQNKESGKEIEDSSSEYTTAKAVKDLLCSGVWDLNDDECKYAAFELAKEDDNFYYLTHYYTWKYKYETEYDKDDLYYAISKKAPSLMLILDDGYFTAESLQFYAKFGNPKFKPENGWFVEDDDFTNLVEDGDVLQTWHSMRWGFELSNIKDYQITVREFDDDGADNNYEKNKELLKRNYGADLKCVESPDFLKYCCKTGSFTWLGDKDGAYYYFGHFPNKYEDGYVAEFEYEYAYNATDNYFVPVYSKEWIESWDETRKKYFYEDYNMTVETYISNSNIVTLGGKPYYVYKGKIATFYLGNREFRMCSENGNEFCRGLMPKANWMLKYDMDKAEFVAKCKAGK